VRLREEFNLYANLRPARTLIPGGRYDKIDLVLVRENLEGLYVGFEHYIAIGEDEHAVAVASGVNTRAGARRATEFAFDYAAKHGRKKVTIVHKAERAQGASRASSSKRDAKSRRSTKARSPARTGSSTRARCNSCSTRGATT
jgi:isocitrate/isopropylmalate dehydrogenase